MQYSTIFCKHIIGQIGAKAELMVKLPLSFLLCDIHDKNVQFNKGLGNHYAMLSLSIIVRIRCISWNGKEYFALQVQQILDKYDVLTIIITSFNDSLSYILLNKQLVFLFRLFDHIFCLKSKNWSIQMIPIYLYRMSQQ